MTDLQQLQKCTRCQCNILLETYFSKNRKGQYNKTCDRCRFRFKCLLCDYTCSVNINLKTHIKMVHTQIKDVKCPTCEYKCSTNGDLQRHIKQVHDKLKDCQCPHCEYKCSTNVHLQRHIKQVHSKIKDFQCPTCEYKCSDNGSLKIHIKICVGDEVGSSGEVKIKKILNEMKIDYHYNTSYELKNEKNNYLRWDFILDCDEPLFIEYDGKQHFEPQRFGGISKEQANEAFEKQKKYDKLKDDYCNEKGYLLLRIPYTAYKNIEILICDFIQENTNWGCE